MKEQTTHTLRPGTILEERYRIERVIGQGGFGITYEAVNEKIEMTVAIKEFYCRDYTSRNVEESNDIQITSVTQQNFERAKRRFLQEAKILSGFSDENAIVRILDYFEENGTAYIVMNYLYGTPLDQYLQKHGVMSWREVLEKFRPLIETLERVHNRGVIHRDISPSNIMVLENESLCLLDFGSAKDRFIEDGETATAIFSKQGYTPIEQYAHNGQLGAWTDIYALTAVLYECLTGTHPPDSVQRAIYDEYETLQDKGMEAPAELDALLKKGLAVRVEGRYSNMGDLLDALNSLLVEKKSKKMKWICLTILFVVCLCTAAGVWFVHSYQEQIFFKFEKTESFRLVRGENTTIDDFDRDFRRIEERIKILTGGEPYIWKKEANEFYGVLPLACLGKEDPREVIRDLIARPCKWTICDIKPDTKYIEHIGFTDAEEQKLEITLSDKTPKKMQDNLEGLCKDKATLSVDFGYKDHLYLEGKMDTPLKFTWDLQNKWKDKKMRRLFVHNISEDALSVILDVHSQIQAVWETEDSGNVFGKKQCVPEELGDDTVTLEYKKTYEDERTEGEIADFMQCLKDRLDLLDIPYAAGREKNHRKSIVLCVNQQDYNKDLFWLLFREKSDMEIKDAWDTRLVYGDSISGIEVGSASSKSSSVAVTVSKEYESNMEEARKGIKNMEQRGIEYYYLAVNGMRLLKGKRSGDSTYTELMKQGHITFSSMCMANERLDGENDKIIKLLNAIIASKYEMYNGRDLFASQFSDADNAVAVKPKKTNKKYCFSTVGEKKIVEKIKALSDQYDVEAITDYEMGEKNLRVMLSNQIYSESLLDHEIAIKQICRIMKECDLEQETPWNGITIGISSRYNKGDYAARLMLNRGFYTKKKEKAYGISVIAYEKQEGKWIKEIYEKMKADDRFKGYGIEFSDFTNYYVY